MKRTLIILLAIVMCLSVTLLVACGCQHYFENGACQYCGEEDPNYDPNDFACAHYYVNGACKYCAEVDANWQEPICQHYYVNGVCNKCGDVDTNYIPVTPPSDTEKTATSIRVLGKYGKNGQTANVAGTVFAVDTNGYYVNDGTAAIFVEDATTVAVGDVVYLSGTLQFSGVNKATFVATQAEVLSQGATVAPAKAITANQLADMPVTANNYYQYLEMTAFVGESEGTYTLSVEDGVVFVDANSASAFQSLVGQKVVATVVVVDYTSKWVVKTASADAVEIVPADLDVVADEIFAWAQTQLPEETFADFTVPTYYNLEPTVTFTWSVSGVVGVSVQDNNLVVINGVSQKFAIPLTLTLSCDGKTASYTYSVNCNADFIFEWAQKQIPAKMPLSYAMPTSYMGEGNVKFEWAVEEGNAIEVANNVLTVVAANATQDTVAKVRLTITSGNNEMSQVFDVNIPANGLSTYDQIATLPEGTTAKIVGTIISKGYDNGTAGTTREYGITILSESKQLFTATCKDKTQWSGYTIGDTVEITGDVFKRYDAYTGKTVYRMSLSCDDVTVVAPAPANFKVDLTGVDVVTLETMADYQALVANFQDKTGNTIVKIVNPYMTSSSASAAGNFIRFGPDDTAKNGYSTKVDGKSYKREFTFFRALYQEIDKTSYDKYTVPYNGKGCTQNMVEIYAVIMFMGDTSWQFVPLGADFTTFPA